MIVLGSVLGTGTVSGAVYLVVAYSPAARLVAVELSIETDDGTEDGNGREIGNVRNPKRLIGEQPVPDRHIMVSFC